MYERLVLPNGVRVVSEAMPYVRSAAVGIWIGVGSRNEKADENGAAHYIEHMLFKGTDRYSAGELAAMMDGIGGQINAYTTRESTCFYARVLDTHLDTAIDLLSGMFFDSLFAQEDVENERGVIQEEIDMYDDTPEDLAVERLLAKCFRGPLGRPVLGKPSTLANLTGERLRAFKETHYRPDRIVISLCGSFTEQHIQRISNRFSQLEPGKAPVPKRAVYTPALFVKKKATEQNHLCIGFPGRTTAADDRFSLAILSTVLGGGMSSRLFQAVRERYGLCYAIYSFHAAFQDTGFFGIETALGIETEEKALRIIFDEVNRIRQEGVTEEELDRAREQAKSNLVMTMESTSSRMNKLGNGELFLGYSLDLNELMERYDAVTQETVLETAQNILDFSRLSFSAVGRVRTAAQYQEWLAALFREKE